MIFPTVILRAALHCVADESKPRDCLQGVYITPTHIHAINGRAAVMMEHDADTDIDAVFIVKGAIPDNAFGTLIKEMDDGWVAVHVDDNDQPVGRNELICLDCQYPDFSKIMPAEPEQTNSMPMFDARLLALPYLMFGESFAAVKFTPSGKHGPCQLHFDAGVNRLYGNPFMVIMPLRENAFEVFEEVLNED